MRIKIVQISLFVSFAYSYSMFFPGGVADAQQTGPQAPNLIGTIQSGDFIGAVLTNAKGEQLLYRLKEKLPDGSQLVTVYPDSIVLIGPDGRNYQMYINHERKAIESSTPAVPANHYAQPTFSYAPLERIPNSRGKRPPRRESAKDEE